MTTHLMVKSSRMAMINSRNMKASAISKEFQQEGALHSTIIQETMKMKYSMIVCQLNTEMSISSRTEPSIKGNGKDQ